MAPTGSDSWLTDYQGVDQLGQDIIEKINDRNKLQRNGSNYSRVQSDVRVQLKNFSREVENLKQSLARASASYHITEREVERRQDMLDRLVTREKQLNSAFKGETTADTGRSLLLAGSSRASNDPWSSEIGPEDNPLSVGEIRTQQHQVIEEQDKGLDALSAVIQRQKMMGQAIGDEIDYHNELIDDISGQVDTTNVKLVRETTRVKKVTAKSGNCAMIVVVVLLLIAIVVVAVVPKPS